MRDRGELIARLTKAKKSSNDLDVAVEIALFKPDQYHVAVRANSAGTKVIYTRPGRSIRALSRKPRCA